MRGKLCGLAAGDNSQAGLFLGQYNASIAARTLWSPWCAWMNSRWG